MQANFWTNNTWSAPADLELAAQVAEHLPSETLVRIEGRQHLTTAGEFVQAYRNSGPGLGALVSILGGAYLVARLWKYIRTDPERRAIERSAREHERKGALVAADIAGWARPPVINGHIPDVFASYPDGTVAIEEFENDRSVDGTHAHSQHEAFTQWSHRSPYRTYLQVVVSGGRGGRAA
jgi:hypothetical protein